MHLSLHIHHSYFASAHKAEVGEANNTVFSEFKYSQWNELQMSSFTGNKCIPNIC